MPKLSFREVFEAIEILTPDNPEGVTSDLVWSSFFGEQCEKTQVTATLNHLYKKGYLVRHSSNIHNNGKLSFCYLPSGKKYNLTTPPPPGTRTGSTPYPFPKKCELERVAGHLG